MTQKQKAKAYDKAIDIARKLYNSEETSPDVEIACENIFPELIEENENEKIRKELIDIVAKSPITFAFEDKEKVLAWLEKQGSEPNWCHHKVDLSNCSEEYRKAYYDGWNNCNLQHSQCKSELNDVLKCLINGMKFYYEDNKEATWGTEKFSMKVKDILSWLEKQAQKPADKVKFKVGDWVVSPNGVYWHIDKIYNNRYEVTSNTGESSNWNLDTNIYHKFTSQDAKKGDILACDKCILIFDQSSEFKNEQVLMDICHCTSKGFYLQDTKDRDLWVSSGFKPATKDQCDTLFTKMHEAGYEWDNEKKELKKIEQEPIDYNEELKSALFTSLRDAREQYLREKNAAWSEEDENMIRGLIAICDELAVRHSYYPVENCDIEKLKNWLKALKQRIGE